MPKMIVRKYKPSDCEALAELFYNTVHTVNAKDYTKKQLDAWADGSLDPEKWNASFLAHYSLIAEEDGEIVGFGDIDDTGYLDRLFVHADRQRRGVASAICNMLESYMRGSSHGASVCGGIESVGGGKITVHASVTARPFFEKRGYKVVKPQEVERHGVVLTNFVMEKEI